MDRPPVIEASKPYDIAVAERLMQRLTPGDLRDRQGARVVDAGMLAYLSGAPEGRVFLGMPPRRVLVRGTPARSCPIALARAGSATDRISALAAQTLEACLQRAKGTDCGCQVVAAGSILMVPVSEMAYATGTAVRIRAPSLGLDGFLVAEDGPDGATLLRDVNGPVGRIERGEDGAVTVRLADSGQLFTGTARQVGYRRGRLAERIYVRAPDGSRISLLIGFDPAELAEFAGGWLAWPPDAG